MRFALSLSAVALAACTGTVLADGPDFAKEVQPVLAAKCLKCHGEDDPKGNLDLRSKGGMLAGGDSGPAIVEKDAAKSLLVQRITAGEMPPKESPQLTAAEAALLKAWIEAGAVAPNVPLPEKAGKFDAGGRKHWAFQKIARPALPQVRDAAAAASPIDSLVLKELENHGLRFSGLAEKRMLIRRVYLDLLGLPPGPPEVEAFLADADQDAYERLLDRVLASPHFGERWGRHWLDAAGYVDVGSTDNDAAILHPIENRWMYRDYVVRAYNTDKPWREFLSEQLAGDELVDWRNAPTYTPEIRDSLIATGFLRASADDTFAPELNTPVTRYAVLQRTSEILANNLLGLTVNCAKCHDHKYEPISQKDYYRLISLVQPVFNPDAWLQPAKRQLPGISPQEQEGINRHNGEIDKQVGELQGQIGKLQAPYQTKLAAAKLETVPAAIRGDLQAALAIAADKRTEVQKYLADKLGPMVTVKPEEVAATLNEGEKTQVAELQKQIGEKNAQKKSWPNWQVVSEPGPPTPTRLLKRGNFETPGVEVTPGFVNILCGPDAPGYLKDSKPVVTSSGRRLALAKWLTDETSPAAHLAVRVQVNRVWQHLFGKGLAETPDNLGLTGSRPTHPELLEWLSAEYLASGGRLKPLLRKLMTSRVYLQTSTVGPESIAAAKVDPENRWLWRMRLRRLESEAARDCILAASGRLDTTIGGAPIPVEPKPDGTFVIPEKGLPTATSKWRRTIYLLARRNYHPALLAVFDQPNLTMNCTRRESSAVVLQSLAMLNDPVVVEQAVAFAERVEKEAGTTEPTKQIETAWQIALGRAPSASETQACAELLQKQAAHFISEKQSPEQAVHQALTQLCHMLLNTSEFIYIP
ncbi:MAG: PSD1 and planctomycete cytochrome C domain-containing protein [Planctomycetales bacterium]|nr:PSD1 and planctomycete cytochrome C domain-containing protein [Planctomycetales bacterium]